MQLAALAWQEHADITDKLMITVGIVKKYRNTIYGKLGVGTRIQAITRRRECDLL